MSAIALEINRASLAAAPEPLLPELAPPVPFPVEALPPILRAAAEAIAEHVKAPPVLAAHAVLGAAAHLAQARVNAPHLHKPEGMPCSLFLLTLADSGDRKSECQRLAFKIIDEAEREARKQWQDECRRIKAEQRGDGKKKPKGEPPAMPPDPRTVYASDASFSKIVANFIHGQSYASWSTDEGGQFFGGHSLANKETRTATLGGLVRLFDTGYTERDRASNNLDGSGFAYGRRLSIILLAQEITVRAALSDPLLQGQGFLPRFLFASAPSLAGTRFLSAEDLERKSYGDARLQRFWERCRDVYLECPVNADQEGALAPPVLALDDAARAEWLNFYNRTEGAQAPLQELDTLKPFASRAGELARRLAAVLAFFEGKPAIDGETMRSACEIVWHSLSEWARYIDASRVDPNARIAQNLMRWLTDPKRAGKWRTFTRDQLGKGGPPVIRTSSKTRDRALALLVKSGHLFTVDEKCFSIPPTAVFAETAESPIVTRFLTAENLRSVADTRGRPEPSPSQSAEIRSLPQKARSLKRDHSDVSAESAESANTPGASAHEGGFIEIEL